MSIYNHINDPKEKEETCSNCGKMFTWAAHGPFYPGGKDTEFIECPYCGERNGSIRTSGSVYSSKIEQ